MILKEPKIIFCGLDHALCRAWENAIVSTPLPIAWDVRHQDIVTLECTAAVSPANSFGFMDGGVDLAYSRHFGWHVQQRLQKAIQTMEFSELLVGQALAVETDYGQIPWLIAAPTMRVPGQILDSTAVFLAARAAMKCAIDHEMDTMAFPGMGTGTGGVRYEVAAKMMILGCMAAISPQDFPKSLREMFIRGPIAL